MNFTKISWTKIAIAILVIGIAGWLLSYFGVKIFNNLRDAIRNKDLVDKANAEIKDSDVTLTSAQASTLADKIFSALRGLGTDEEAVYSAFRMLRSRSDLLLLSRTFGVRGGRTLNEWLAADLSQKELDKVNQILATNGITYSFFTGN